MKEEEEAESFATSLVVRARKGTDQSYRTGSNENQSSPSEAGYQADSEDNEDDKEAVHWANSQVKGWKHEQEQQKKGKDSCGTLGTRTPVLSQYMLIIC